MGKLKLEKEGSGFFITLLEGELYTYSGPEKGWKIPLGKRLAVRKASQVKDGIALGTNLVKKEDLYDFLCDEGKKVVSRPGSGGSITRFKFSDYHLKR